VQKKEVKEGKKKDTPQEGEGALLGGGALSASQNCYARWGVTVKTSKRERVTGESPLGGNDESVKLTEENGGKNQGKAPA